MEIADFLRTVITTPEGYLVLCIGGPGHGWAEEFFEYPKQINEIVTRATAVKDQTNVYFSSYLFSEPRSRKKYALPSRTIQADLDNAKVENIPITPTLLVRTSANRHQGYWILDEALTPDVHEVLSRKITYSIPDCDHSGWPIAHKVRLSGTVNHKYLEGPQDIDVVNISGRIYREVDLELLPDVTIVELERYDEKFLDFSVAEYPPANDWDGPNTLLESIKTKLPTQIYQLYNSVAGDRSKYLWTLMLAAFRAGLTREQVYYLAERSANNKFKDLKHNGPRELAKDVLRAQSTVKSNVNDVHSEIANARKLSCSIHDKRQLMFSIVLNALRDEGEFIRTADDNMWYIQREQGRPIMVSPRSEYLDMIMDIKFGLNNTETDQSYVISSLCNYCRGLPATGVTASLTHYDKASNTLLLHTGKREVLRISSTEIARITDGAYGIVFPWSTTSDPFNPQNIGAIGDWGEVLFGKSIDNLIGLTKPQGMAILKAWVLFLLFKDMSTSRPLLALFGMPGSGKSTIFKLIYGLIYGSHRSIGGVTTPQEFDQAMSYDSFVGLDNVDTWEKWLPDRLAQAAGTMDRVVRKLYTDADTMVIKRQALVGITAHNPKFSREDITDRFLLLNFERLKTFKPEGELTNEIINKRNQLWGSIVRDIQLCLSTPVPQYNVVPQFRIEDFALIGFWVAAALGFKDDFVAALELIRIGQKTFNLETDAMLVDIINTYVSRNKTPDKFVPVGTLFHSFSNYAQDEHGFMTIYKNAKFLGSKLWVLQDSLKEIFDISWHTNASSGAREWAIKSKAVTSE